MTLTWLNPHAVDPTGAIVWSTEFIAREVNAHDKEEETSDWGLVSTITYQLSPRWQAGFRIDYVSLDHHAEEHEDEHDEEGEDEHHDEEEHDEHDEMAKERTRLSPMIAWRPTDSSTLRLQYNFTTPDEGDNVHSVWLGYELALGGHHHDH